MSLLFKVTSNEPRILANMYEDRRNDQIDLLRRPTLPLTVASGTRCKICLRNASYRESYPHAPQYSILTTAGLPIVSVQNSRVNVRQ